MSDDLEDCETCSQGQGPLQRCAVCRRRVCDDCTNHPGDDAGPCVECEPPRARPMEYAPMDNGTVDLMRPAPLGWYSMFVAPVDVKADE